MELTDMYINTESGITEKSEIFFSSQTASVESPLFYPICTGHYFCNSDYCVERKKHYSILIMQILASKCKVETEFTNSEAKAGDIVVIDCCKPHRYYTLGNHLETIWLHIDGANCHEICNEIVSQNGNVFHPADIKQFTIKLFEIYNLFAENKFCPQAKQSSYIYDLLCDCLCHQYQANDKISKTAIDYINSNLDKKITVSAIADTVHLSSSQFSKRFKEETGYSPYDFVLITRLNKAKYLLLNSSLQILEIANQTGFDNCAKFSAFFSSTEGISPRAFRNSYSVI